MLEPWERDRLQRATTALEQIANRLARLVEVLDNLETRKWMFQKPTKARSA